MSDYRNPMHRTHHVSVALNNEELYSLDMYCKRHNVSKSVWIRDLITAQIDKECDKE